MGFINVVKGIIAKFKAAGKTENEISEIIEEAAEKASVNKEVLNKRQYEKPEIKTESSIEAFRREILRLGITAEQAAEAIRRMGRSKGREERKNTNNWRKMHGLPMRRKQKARKRHERGKRADCHRQNTNIS